MPFYMRMSDTPMSDFEMVFLLFFFICCNISSHIHIMERKTGGIRDICCPVVGNINDKMERVDILRLLEHVFKAAVPQILCQLMEKSLSSSAK